MNRRGRSGQLPWGSPGRGGTAYTQGRKPGQSRVIILGGIVVAVLVLAFLGYGQLCGGDDCDDVYCASGQKIAAPDGYELVSKVFTLKPGVEGIPDGQEAKVGLTLNKPTTDARSIGFYRYVEETKAWEPLAAALLEGDRTAVATLQEMPKTIAVMRRLLPAGQVVAYLPPGQPLHADAAGRVTIVHTNDFTPAADGEVVGNLTVMQLDKQVAHYPSIIVRGSDRGSLPVITGILSSAQSRSNHVANIVKVVNEKNLAGIDIAYLDLPADQRTSFSLFITELGQRLRAQNKFLTLTIPAPIVVQDRVDEGAYDWAELGKSADVLQMAPYRDQGTYRTAMPVILQHLTSIVEPSKLVLTVTPYATEKSADGIRTLILSEAMSIAARLQIEQSADQKVTTSSNVKIVATNINKDEQLSGIVWQPETACVAFTYKSGSNRTVWIENFFSIGFKLDFITQYKLGGVAVEDASDNVYLGNIWTALLPFISGGQPVLMQPNREDLLPYWEVSKGEKEGGDRAGQRGYITWVTPAEPGTYNVKLRLSEGQYWFENEIAIQVQPREARTPSASATAQATPTR